MIILTKEQRDYILGNYGSFNAIEPVQLNETEYYLPEAILNNPECRDAWEYLKALPTRLLTADDLVPYEGEVNTAIENDNYLYGIVVDYGNVNGYDIKAGLVRTGNWSAEKLTIYLNIEFWKDGVKDSSKTQRVDLVANNDIQYPNGQGGFVGDLEHLGMQIMAGVNMIDLTKSMIMSRRDYILREKLK